MKRRGRGTTVPGDNVVKGDHGEVKGAPWNRLRETAASTNGTYQEITKVLFHVQSYDERVQCTDIPG